MTKVINLWAGPGAGKSTVAADTFAEMKWQGYNCELVTECAKEIVWEGHHNLLSDQLYISGNQNRRLQRLLGQVDYIITDTPLLLCAIYAKDYGESFQRFMLDTWAQYDNLNFFIEREKKYNPLGRMQNEAEARTVDNQVRHLLDSYDFPYVSLKGNRNAKHKIIETIEAYAKHGN